MIAYNRRQQLIADAHVAAAAAKAAAAPAVGGSVHQGFAGARLPVAAAVSPVAVDASVWDEHDQQQQRPGQAAQQQCSTGVLHAAAAAAADQVGGWYETDQQRQHWQSSQGEFASQPGSQTTQNLFRSQGMQGHFGSQGTQGLFGSQGTQGLFGSQGTQGMSGSQPTQDLLGGSGGASGRSARRRHSKQQVSGGSQRQRGSGGRGRSGGGPGVSGGCVKKQRRVVPPAVQRFLAEVVAQMESKLGMSVAPDLVRAWGAIAELSPDGGTLRFFRQQQAGG
jgi:hypothetical protein